MPQHGIKLDQNEAIMAQYGAQMEPRWPSRPTMGDNGRQWAEKHTQAQGIHLQQRVGEDNVQHVNTQTLTCTHISNTKGAKRFQYAGTQIHMI